MTHEPPEDQSASNGHLDAPTTSSTNPGPGKKRRRRKKSPFPGNSTAAATSTRHQSRVLALQTLYELDVTDHTVEELSDRVRDNEDVLPIVRDYAGTLVGGVSRHAETIDGYIGEAASDFPIAQIAVIDRNVLRIAVYELMNQRKTVPVRVAINEAIDIAKDFGGENSGKFVHGVLGTISKRLETPETP
ncbi:MAG: transcription antitermination factor NusB [Chloroflexota bacterium]|nr:transcription antitermination factor NusB [Chloroflexota bacterium]